MPSTFSLAWAIALTEFVNYFAATPTVGIGKKKTFFISTQDIKVDFNMRSVNPSKPEIFC